MARPRARHSLKTKDNGDVTTFLFGKRFPNRLFVGGLPVNTTAAELADFFKKISNVTEAKVIMDEEGISKGYGFVTFQTKKDIDTVKNMGTIFFKNKKLNLGPAVKKEGPTIQPEVVIVPNAPSHGQFYYPEHIAMPPACMAFQQPQHQQPMYYYPYQQQAPQGMYYAGWDYPCTAQPTTYIDPVSAGQVQYYQVIGDSVQWIGGEVPLTAVQERRGSTSSSEMEPVVPGIRTKKKSGNSKRRSLPPRLRAMPRTEVPINPGRHI